MFGHYKELAKYWAATARAHHAAGLHHLGALYQSYADKHALDAMDYVS